MTGAYYLHECTRNQDAVCGQCTPCNLTVPANTGPSQQFVTAWCSLHNNTMCSNCTGCYDDSDGSLFQVGPCHWGGPMTDASCAPCNSCYDPGQTFITHNCTATRR
eukprot:574465-Rhodomonas_salina.1